MIRVSVLSLPYEEGVGVQEVNRVRVVCVFVVVQGKNNKTTYSVMQPPNV